MCKAPENGFVSIVRFDSKVVNLTPKSEFISSGFLVRSNYIHATMVPSGIVLYNKRHYRYNWEE